MQGVIAIRAPAKPSVIVSEWARDNVVSRVDHATCKLRRSSRHYGRSTGQGFAASAKGSSRDDPSRAAAALADLPPAAARRASRAIFEAPITLPWRSLSGETVSDTSMPLPSLWRRTVSKDSTRSPSTDPGQNARLFRHAVGREESSMTLRPTISAAV